MAAENNDINKAELEKVLTKIIEELQNKGLIPAMTKEAMNALVDKVVTHLEDQKDLSLSAHDLKNENVRKLLSGVVVSQLLGIKNDEFTEKLKSENKDQPDEKMDKKLGAGLKLLDTLLTLQLKFDNKNNHHLLQDSLKPAFDSLKKTPRPEPGQKEKTDKEINLLEENLTNTLRSLFGGDDPRVAGEVVGPVLGQIVGNLFGFTNQTTANPESQAFMVNLITTNFGKFDYTGGEALSLTADLSSGIAQRPGLSL